MGNIPVYVIDKSRLGLNGVWEGWRYNATEQTSDVAVRGNERYHGSIEDLAESIAQHPHDENQDAEFIPGNERGHGPRVSLVEGVMTQWGTVTDDELGQLGSLVQKYIKDNAEAQVT